MARQPWRVPYAYVAEFLGAQQIPALGTVTVPIDIDREADFAIYNVGVFPTSFDLRYQLTDQASQLYHDGFQPIVNLVGTGQLPRSYQAARVIRRTNQLRITLVDFSGAPNNVRMIFTGAQLFPSPAMPIPAWIWSEDFAIAARFGPEAFDNAPTIAANGSGEFTIRTPGDAWFETHALAMTQTGACSVQLLNDGNREWFRRPVHSALLGATSIVGLYAGGPAAIANLPASWPYRFMPPRLLPRNTGITVRVNDLSGAPNAVRVSFLGMKRYPREGG